MDNKKSTLARLGTSLGEFVGSYREAAALKAVGEANLKPPEYAVVLARGERWSGGSNPERLSSQQRSVQNSWVYIAISKRAGSVRGAPFDIYGSATGIEDEDKPLPDHPLKKLLKSPNPLMSGAALMEYSQWWADLDGNVFWFIEVDGSDKPVAIYPMPSSDVTVYPDETGERFIEKYTYEPRNWGGQFDIDPRYVVHLKYANPFNFFRGMSPLVAALLPAESDTAMAYWNGTFFGNDNVMPSSVITLSSGDAQRPIDAEDVEAIKKKLTESYAASARRTVVTNAFDMKVEQLGWSAREMDFLSGRQFTKEEIFSIYGVHAGMTDPNATEANAKAGIMVYESVVYDLLQLWDDQLTMQLAQRFYGENVYLKHEDTRAEDESQKLQEATAHSTHLTIDEYRELYLGLDPLPNGRGAKLPGEQDAEPTQLAVVGEQTAPERDGGSVDAAVRDTENELDTEPEMGEDVRKAIVDLNLFRKKSYKNVKKNGKAIVGFVSDYLKPELVDAIKEDLEQANDIIVAKSIFDYYEEWLETLDGRVGSGNLERRGSKTEHE